VAVERGLREMRVHGVVLDEEDREGEVGLGWSWQ
jgi:hypothetical protein